MEKGALLLTVLVNLCGLLLHSTKAVNGGNDSLRPGDKLNQSSSTCLQSAKHTYRMCISEFPAGSGLTYLQIFEQSTSSLVWTANRDKPLANNSGVLTLDHFGVLQILCQSCDKEQPITLFCPIRPINNNTTIVATLLDSGNFVLQQLRPNGSLKIVLWQSFDYPTNVLIPGMKLGVNYKIGHSWSLLSRLNSGVLNSGAFSLTWDPKSGQLTIRRRGTVDWASGVLKNNKFQFISEEAQSMYEYTIVSTKDEGSSCFRIHNKEDQKYVEWHLHDNGLLRDNRGRDIARLDDCYGYSSDGGCQKLEVPSCRHEGDVFVSVSGNLNDTNSLSLRSDRNVSLILSDCRATCFGDCDCVAFESYFQNGTGCSFYHGNSGEAINSDSGGQCFLLQTRKPARRKGAKKWLWMLVTPFIILCLFILGLATKMRKKVLKEEKQGKRIDTDDQDNFKKGDNIEVINYQEVMAATNGFSSENKLGHGGFGPVYKGIFPTGEEIAIKKLSKTSGQGIIEFKNELQVISELQHKNLVLLLGCCIHEEERMLIYEYMPNKSLDFFLFDHIKSTLLDWKKRFNIIEGISQGLLYLHKYSRFKVIHRDLKASNILLDENMNPKISDFGMARMFTQQESEVNTNRIVGTYGYMSPEYAMEGVLSTKSDVYSFGVLLLEIVSGRRNTTFCDTECTLNLVGYAWKLWNENEGLQLVDPSLDDSFDLDEVQRCIHIGLLCVEECADDRPTMSDIISMFTNISAKLTFPRRPAFYSRRKCFEKSELSYNNSICEISVCEVESR